MGGQRDGEGLCSFCYLVGLQEQGKTSDMIGVCVGEENSVDGLKIDPQRPNSLGAGFARIEQNVAGVRTHKDR